DELLRGVAAGGVHGSGDSDRRHAPSLGPRPARLKRYFGGMRMAPSRRMSSPLSSEFSQAWRTRAAYSDGRPNRLGNGMLEASCRRVSSGAIAIIGVSNVPGAIVTTRMQTADRTRAAGSGVP